VLLVLVVLGLLALSGVFSSNRSHTARPPAEAPPATSTATTTTTPATASNAKPVPAPKNPLKPGDTGRQVEVLQRALASLGFSSGTIDGQYGPATSNAVARFQQSVKITADGVAGPATLAALASALRGP
jgi:peptidoglycan hydrolase-like protein with peptidoglycan-binding domain